MSYKKARCLSCKDRCVVHQTLFFQGVSHHSLLVILIGHGYHDIVMKPSMVIDQVNYSAIEQLSVVIVLGQPSMVIVYHCSVQTMDGYTSAKLSAMLN